MRYKKFGSMGFEVSAITVGTWAMGGDRWGSVQEKDCIAAIHAMLDNGVNHIDTAPGYGKGYAEEVVGRAVKGRDRSKLFITTKAGIIFGGDIEEYERDISSASILKEIDMSLSRLGLDYIDLYLVHKPDRKNTPFDDTMSAMMKILESGKVRHIGISNFTVEQTKEIEKYGKVEAVQPPFCMINRSQLDVVEYAHSKGMGVMSYGSLGAGVLTGAFRTMPDLGMKDSRRTFYNYYKEPYFSKAQDLLKVMDKIADARGVPLPQIAINWNTQHPMISTALLGVVNVREAEENCAALSWSLTQEEMDTLNKAIDRYEEETKDA